ncbi:hypothetical protein ABZN20_16100 [Methylococcus sp. ANG]|jgi:hypothetical protein|uniref:HVO_A0114 family putative DNA-binding protein n=1 Tax=Methylococcus sp. ANG TaxID=3231903 RepID=UPI00345877FB
MTGAAPMTLREVSRRASDVKAVHGDVNALRNAGLLDKAENGRVVFPYDSMHVDNIMKAARILTVRLILRRPIDLTTSPNRKPSRDGQSHDLVTQEI